MNDEDFNALKIRFVRLTFQAVVNIRSDTRSVVEICKAYRMSETQISDILKGKYWSLTYEK